VTGAGPRKARKPGYLTLGVDAGGLAVWAAQSAQVGHHAVLPQKRVRVARLNVGVAHNLASVVDANGGAIFALQGTQIGDRPAL